VTEPVDEIGETCAHLLKSPVERPFAYPYFTGEDLRPRLSLGQQLNDPTLQLLQQIGLVCAPRRQHHLSVLFQQPEQFVI
jgi:hypothetical protein